MGEALGPRLILNCPVVSLDVANRRINGEFEADVIVNTAPWPIFGELSGVSDRAKAIVAGLKHTSVDIEYVGENLDTPAQWIYLPDPSLPEHRILVRHNFCPGSHGYWKETRHERSLPPRPDTVRYTMDFAYPLNTIGKNEAMAELLGELRANNVLGLGRWGEWQHYNSDLVVDIALKMAKSFICGSPLSRIFAKGDGSGNERGRWGSGVGAGS